ncbi:MAG: GNAT family N-acetyltransferase [Verrucomicrobia bacterium]|nr:GNAT family N-acetyltransferase [Verrucomicrobiota bacterium]
MRPPTLPIPQRLQTGRLVLVAPRRGDGQEVNQAVRESFRELHRWMPWAKQRPTMEETESFCRKAARDISARQEFSFLLRLRDGGVLVGAGGLVRGDWSVPKFEIGYWLRTKFIGHGFATEAAKVLTAFARRHLRVRRLEIRIDPRNTRSAAVARRAGFKLEAILRQDARDNRGRLRDTQVFVKLF